MVRRGSTTLLGLALAAVLGVAPVRAQDAAALQFVSTFARQLNVLARDRLAPRETAGAKDAANCGQRNAAIHTELRTNIRILNGLRLDAPVRREVAEIFEARDAIHKKLVDICAAIYAGPKEGVDYGALAGEMRALDGKVTDNDKRLFDVVPAVAGAIEAPGLSKSDRDWLVTSLSAGLGEALERKHGDYLVGAAALLKERLTREAK